MPKTVDEIINKYYAETAEGLSNEKTPSELNRGEGTEADYYILKIDLCNSTLFFLRRSSQTYFKIAHVFLSTIDDITRTFGSDARQVEYAGDSVMAYFPNNYDMALNVLKAAYFARTAMTKMKSLDQTFGNFPFKSRIIMHYGKLILGNIGPWGDYNLTAIGMPLHVVAKLEKNVQPDNGLATKEFAAKLSSEEKKTFLTGNYSESLVEVHDTPAYISNKPSFNYNFGIGDFNLARKQLSPLAALLNPAPQAIVAKPRYETKQELVNYNVNWIRLQRFLEGKNRL